MKIVIFEGLDCSGKTTLINAVKDSLKGKAHPMFIDRFIHSNYVYESIKGTLDFVDLYEFYSRCVDNFTIIVVYLDVPINVIKDRLYKCSHEPIDDELLHRQKQLFESSFVCLPVHRVVVDTTKPISECVKMICGVIV